MMRLNCGEILLNSIIRAVDWVNQLFAYARTKTQISFSVTAKLIGVFGFATRIVQFLYSLDPTFPALGHLL